MLTRLTNEHLNWRWFDVPIFWLLDDSLNRIAKELSNNVFKMALDVRESRVEMAFDFNGRHLDVRALSFANQFLRCFGASIDNLPCFTMKKDLANKLGVRVNKRLL